MDRLDYSRLLIKYCNDSTLYSLKVTADGIDEMALAILPIKSVRFGGWLDLKADHSGQGKYWYAISEGKIAIVTNLGR